MENKIFIPKKTFAIGENYDMAIKEEFRLKFGGEPISKRAKMRLLKNFFELDPLKERKSATKTLILN